MIGVDGDADAIAEARELAGGPSYVHADIRDYQPEPGTFDVVIIMSQSFGYFDPTTNCDVLSRLAVSVREGGRVILDLWNQEFFAAHQGERELETAGTGGSRAQTTECRPALRTAGLSGRCSGRIRMAVVPAGKNDFIGAVSQPGPVTLLHRFRHYESAFSR